MHLEVQALFLFSVIQKYLLGSCKNKPCLSIYSLATTKKITFRFKAVEMAHMRRYWRCRFRVCVLLSHQVIRNWKTVAKSGKS